MPSIQLYTPGLDSFLSEWVLEKENKRVDKKCYVNLHSVYTENELEFLNAVDGTDVYTVLNHLNMSDLEDHKSFHVANRNLLLVTLIQSTFDADFIYLNGNLEDRVSDNNLEFYQLASQILSKSASKKVEVISPLIDKEKTEWCRLYAEDPNNDKYNLLSLTYSCFDSEWNHYSVPVFEKSGTSFKPVGESIIFGCLKCPACIRKAHALTGANIYYPTKNIELGKSYLNTVDPNIHPNRFNAVVEHNAFMSVSDFVWTYDDDEETK